MVPLLSTGYNKDQLEVEDLYEVLDEHRAKHLGDQLEQQVFHLLFQTASMDKSDNYVCFAEIFCCYETATTKDERLMTIFY